MVVASLRTNRLALILLERRAGPRNCRQPALKVSASLKVISAFPGRLRVRTELRGRAWGGGLTHGPPQGGEVKLLVAGVVI